MTPGPKDLDHYFYLWYDGTFYWVTPSGLSTTPVPLTTFTPVDLADIQLLSSDLTPGAWVFGWLMLDGATYVNWDSIVVWVTP